MPFSDRQPRWSFAHRVSLALLGFVLAACFGSAQLAPPLTAIKWLTQTDGDWDAAGNWSGGFIPDGGADVLFGNVSGGPANPDAPAIAVSNNDARSLKSLWFDGSAGIFYSIGGAGTLTLGGGLPSDDYLIAVIGDWKTQAEHNINNALILDDTVAGRARWVVNNSHGGLRFAKAIDLGSQHLRISGTGATHFAGTLSGSGTLSTLNAFPYSVPHLILNADNSAWSGALNVGVKTLVVVKADAALGTGANTVIAESNPLAGGGTLAFRSHVGSTLNYTAAAPIDVGGAGAVRVLGRPGIGAIYHDGGSNTFSGDITLMENAYFGARGDSGGLTLSGAILGSQQLYKIGRGLITLTNSRFEVTRLSIDEGVLRVTDPQHLAPMIRFGGAKLLFPQTQGILELSGSITHYTASIGTSAGQIYWNGRGGFSAFGGDRTVTLDVPGGVLLWGRRGYPAGWEELLLSSRYADSKITLTTDINFRHLVAGVNVERGVSHNARAELSGVISANGGWFYKFGPGRLDITGANIHNGVTDISEGVLLGNIPSTTNLFLGGGVFGLESDFTRSIGSVANQLRWGDNRSGGFAAYNGDHAVRLNDSSAQIDWEASDFVQTGYEMKFGHYTSDGTVLWDKQLGLGTDQHRTIHIERGIPATAADRADVSFTQALSGTGGSLTIKGDGRFDSAVDNPGLKLDEVRINGAELRLHQAGRITTHATHFTLKNGGTLTLDNLGTHKTTTGGSYETDRIHDDSALTLTASTLRYWGSDADASEEQVGQITLVDGANAIDVRSSAGEAATLKASGLARTTLATLNLTLSGTLAKFLLNSWATTNAINDDGGTPIAPWITVNGLDWASSAPAGTGATFSALTTYHSGDQDTWAQAHNVALTSGQTLGAARLINSLKIANSSGALDLGNFALTLNAGALLSIGGNTLSGTGSVNTAASRPLYTHVYNGALALNGGVQLDVPRLVKTGSGALRLNSNVLHNLGRLYIHQGKVELQQGRISAELIVIGDGAGKDSLTLPANRWEPLINTPSLTLRGTPYGPGADYASYDPDEAILQIGGNTKQHLATLHIENRGTIDFAGSDAALANMLWVDTLTFNNAAARLFIRNWYEYEDYLLVSKSNFGKNDVRLTQIIFDGYQDFPVLAEDYDAHYFLITPFSAPEPSTYGAILAAAGVGLWAWQSRRRNEDTR